jgi:hypothetical protein
MAFFEKAGDTVLTNKSGCPFGAVGNGMSGRKQKVRKTGCLMQF